MREILQNIKEKEKEKKSLVPEVKETPIVISPTPAPEASPKAEPIADKPAVETPVNVVTSDASGKADTVEEVKPSDELFRAVRIRVVFGIVAVE